VVPNYDYECLSCGHHFEAFQNMNAAHLKEVKRLISAGTGLIFKGSGFYATDYKKKAAPDACPKAKEGGCSGCPGKS
jgi:putative FmdB family regulatory protein